jgi:hypothetical protein
MRDGSPPAAVLPADSTPSRLTGARGTSHAMYLVPSIALHGALIVGLLVLTEARELGIGPDYTVVELSLIPGLEQLLEPATPTGEETSDEVTPEPVPAGEASVPERVVERAEPERETPEPVARPPELATSEPPPHAQAEETAAEARAEAAPSEPAPAEATSEGERAAIETELAPNKLAAVVVTAEPRRLPTPSVELAPITQALTASELEVVEHHVESWARSFAALAEWQPNTTWVEDDQEYSASVTRVPAPDNMGIDAAIVTVTTQRDGEVFSTEMRMQRLGFSHFAQFIDRWDPQVQIHDDEIDGRFHSNSEIKIARSGGKQPVFHGKVTTARGIDTSSSDRSVRRDEVFLGGLETRVRRIVLPRRVALFDDEQAIPSDRIHRFEADTRIEFQADGSFAWGDAGKASPKHRQKLGTEPFYLVADEDVVLFVRGTVNGKVLVYSPERIVIEGDLVYAADPTIDSASDDYLGLVAEHTVEVADWRTTGPGSLSIQASIYARDRFAVRGYRTSYQGTLFIHGSITAGSVTATEPRFSTNLSFDRRLEASRPPSFPVTDRFEIAEWDGRWELDDVGAPKTFD